MNVAPASIAVTGSTGALGGLLAGLLAAAGLPQRLLVRSLDRAPVLSGAVALPCSYADRNSSTAALTGAETVLMMSASESADRVQQHHAFVDAACAAGVHHIAIAAGGLERTTSDVELFTGRPPTSLAQLLERTVPG